MLWAGVSKSKVQLLGKAQVGQIFISPPVYEHTGLLTDEKAKSVEKALSDNALLGTLSPGRICQVLTPLVLWGVGRECSLKQNRYSGAGKAASWNEGQWLLDNANIMVSMSAGYTPADIDVYNEKALFPGSTSNTPSSAAGPMAPPTVRVGSAMAGSRQQGSIPLLLDGEGKLHKHAPGSGGASSSGGGTEPGCLRAVRSLDNSGQLSNIRSIQT